MATEEAATPREFERNFGSGFRRKRIDFVPAGATSTTLPKPPSTPSASAGDRYLSIVLKGPASPDGRISSVAPSTQQSDTQTHIDAEGDLCTICKLAIKSENDAASTALRCHEASVAHMVCLAHSYPPSHLNRSRQGLKYLSSYGWDPDSRLGLGAKGEGIRAPVKAQVKNDTVGLGVGLNGIGKNSEGKVKRLDAKRTRQRDMEDRRKFQRLQEMFYMNDDVEKYLGGG